MHETSPCWVYGHGPANQSNRCGASIELLDARTRCARRVPWRRPRK
ncbi:hypothetical protein LC55x_2553 [Lysobacter capsici]|nr:hypothetical protein LC55x_2553 [Lysobacter capsici]